MFVPFQDGRVCDIRRCSNLPRLYQDTMFFQSLASDTSGTRYETSAKCNTHKGKRYVHRPTALVLFLPPRKIPNDKFRLTARNVKHGKRSSAKRKERKPWALGFLYCAGPTKVSLVLCKAREVNTATQLINELCRCWVIFGSVIGDVLNIAQCFYSFILYFFFQSRHVTDTTLLIYCPATMTLPPSVITYSSGQIHIIAIPGD